MHAKIEDSFSPYSSPCKPFAIAGPFRPQDRFRELSNQWLTARKNERFRHVPQAFTPI
jgi:hypothetical protein